MKFKVIFFLFFLFFVQLKAENFSLYKESSHFELYCEEKDQKAGDFLLKLAERHFVKLSKDFNENYKNKIKIMVYPDITAFHNAINKPSSPEWLVGGSDVEKQSINIVSPNNPGSVHNYDSIMRVSKVSLAHLFIHNKYNNKGYPRWLNQGASFLVSNYFIRPIVKEWFLEVQSKNITIPSIEQLDNIDDELAFVKIDGYRISYSLVEFLNEKWGWDIVLKLFDDYGSFEKILDVNKEQFKTQWIQFVKNKYGF